MNELKTFLRILQQPRVVEEIEQLVSATAESKICLCFPNLPSEERDLHLFVYVGKKDELKAPRMSSLTMAIANKLERDDTSDDGAHIVVHYSRLFAEGAEKNLYKDMLPLTTENLRNGNIEKFVASHYPQYVDVSLNRNSGEKDSSEENYEHNAELIAKFLKGHPQLQSSIKTEDAWKQTQRKIEALLQPNFAASSNNTSPGKK